MKVSFGKLLIVLGMLLTAAGFVIGFELQRQIGTGFQAMLAKIFYGADVRQWQLIAGILLVGGLGMCTLGAATRNWKLVRR